MTQKLFASYVVISTNKAAIIPIIKGASDFIKFVHFPSFSCPRVAEIIDLKLLFVSWQTQMTSSDFYQNNVTLWIKCFHVINSYQEIYTTLKCAYHRRSECMQDSRNLFSFRDYFFPVSSSRGGQRSLSAAEQTGKIQCGAQRKEVEYLLFFTASVCAGKSSCSSGFLLLLLLSWMSEHQSLIPDQETGQRDVCDQSCSITLWLFQRPSSASQNLPQSPGFAGCCYRHPCRDYLVAPLPLRWLPLSSAEWVGGCEQS